jgi:hypothetical protein
MKTFHSTVVGQMYEVNVEDVSVTSAGGLLRPNLVTPSPPRLRCHLKNLVVAAAPKPAPAQGLVVEIRCGPYCQGKISEHSSQPGEVRQKRQLYFYFRSHENGI